METELTCHFHDDSDEEVDECMSMLACDACDERQRFALLDSPPVSVLAGIIPTHCHYYYKTLVSTLCNIVSRLHLFFDSCILQLDSVNIIVVVVLFCQIVIIHYVMLINRDCYSY